MGEQYRSAPTLETERLLLRAWRKEDFRPWHAIMHQPEVHRHFGPNPIGEEECWRRMSAGVGSWPLIGIGSWAVERKADGRLIGNVGLFNAWRALDPVFGEEPEMGWIFSTDVHGQGLASEGCRAALGWFDANIEPVPVWAIIAPENAASLKLAERLGFARHNDTTYNDEPTIVLKREL